MFWLASSLPHSFFLYGCQFICYNIDIRSCQRVHFMNMRGGNCTLWGRVPMMCKAGQLRKQLIGRGTRPMKNNLAINGRMVRAQSGAKIGA